MRVAMSAQQLREIQLTELEILKEARRVCDKHHIPYVIIAGTLLGAVRHRGFIPWDFDLDLGVKWGDYQKLFKAWEEDPIPNHDIVNMDRYPTYPTLFSRYVDTRTTELRESTAWSDAPHTPLAWQAAQADLLRISTAM